MSNQDLFQPTLLNDSAADDLIRELTDLLNPYGDLDYQAKVLFFDGREPQVYDCLLPPGDDNDETIASLTFGDDRTPETVSTRLTLRFDEVTFFLETRDDVWFEWYADNCIVFTITRQSVENEQGVRQLVISVNE